jgi:hypothetical protein
VADLNDINVTSKSLSKKKWCAYYVICRISYMLLTRYAQDNFIPTLWVEVKLSLCLIKNDGMKTHV